MEPLLFIILIFIAIIYTTIKPNRPISQKAAILFIFTILLPLISATIELAYDETSWNPFDYARITDVDYTAEVLDEPGAGGKVLITERLTYDIHAASKDNLFWELWRALPESYIDGLKVEYKVNSVKQILDDGTTIVYEQSPTLYWDDEDYVNTNKELGPGKWYHSEGPYNEYKRQYECVLFYVDGLYRENVTFEIEYEMSTASLRYNDCSELYLCMYSEDTIKHLESFKGQILFKNSDMPQEGNYYAHTYGTNATSFLFSKSESKNPGYTTFFFELDKSDLKFSWHNQYLEFALVSYNDDKHIFTEYAPDNEYSNDAALDELKYEHEEFVNSYKEYGDKKFGILTICILISIVIFMYISQTKTRLRKKYKFYNPTTKFDYFRDIPQDLDPSFASALVFCKSKQKKDKGDEYSALMLSLVRKGYIELARINNQKDWNFNNVKIIIKYNTNLKKELEKATNLYNTYKKQNDLISDKLASNQYNSSTYKCAKNLADRHQQQLDELKEKINTYQQQEITEFEPLTSAEEYYFNLIVYHANGADLPLSKLQIKMSTFYQKTNAFVKNVENSVTTIGVAQNYFQKANYQEPKDKMQKQASTFIKIGLIFAILINLISYYTYYDFVFGGYFILGITFLLSGIYLKHISKQHILLTQFGENEYSKWRGLYNFLNSETLINERTIVELPLWEKYLVYATAFGISEKVIKALNIRCPEMNISPMLSNSYCRSTSFRSTGRSFSSATRSASYSARSNSYGGGYGYSGGGRGGGGGRRRSLINYFYSI